MNTSALTAEESALVSRLLALTLAERAQIVAKVDAHRAVNTATENLIRAVEALRAA